MKVVFPRKNGHGGRPESLTQNENENINRLLPPSTDTFLNWRQAVKEGPESVKGAEVFFPRVEEFDIVLKKTADDKYLKPGLALPATELVALKKVHPNSVSEKRSNKLQERK